MPLARTQQPNRPLRQPMSLKRNPRIIIREPVPPPYEGGSFTTFRQRAAFELNPRKIGLWYPPESGLSGYQLYDMLHKEHVLGPDVLGLGHPELNFLYANQAYIPEVFAPEGPSKPRFVLFPNCVCEVNGIPKGFIGLYWDVTKKAYSLCDRMMQDPYSETTPFAVIRSPQRYVQPAWG